MSHHAHRISRLVRADARICARAGLLHDLGAHWFNTTAPCELAQRLEEPHGVWHAIRAHTLFPELPRTKEAWVVVAADLLTSAQECHFVFRRAPGAGRGAPACGCCGRRAPCAPASSGPASRRGGADGERLRRGALARGHAPGPSRVPPRHAAGEGGQ